MKAFAMLLAALVLASSAHAQGMKDHKGMDMKMEKKQAKGMVHKATGVVTRVDAAKNRVTIRHEPVQSLNWPTMNMAFTVKDKAMIARMPKDKKIDFEFVQEGRDYVVTEVK